MNNLRYFEDKKNALQTLDSETPQVWYVEDEDLTLFTYYTEDELNVVPVVDSEGNIELKVRYIYHGLKLTSTGDSTIRININGQLSPPDIKYSLNEGETWTQYKYGNIISLTDGQSVCLKGDNASGISESNQNYIKFVMTGSVAASGNIMSLIDNGACTTTIVPKNDCFYGLFEGCSVLTSSPELPATTLSKWCYCKMFYGCSALTSAPELPATTLVSGCYMYMFYECTSLLQLTCKATNISGISPIDYWLNRISTNGILYVDPSMTGATWNIPSTWTIQAIS